MLNFFSLTQQLLARATYIIGVKLEKLIQNQENLRVMKSVQLITINY